MTETPENKLERYINKEKVGEGTYGKVYKAFDTITQTYVAIKTMKNIQQEDGISPLTLREISILKSVSHPTLVKLRDVIVEPNSLTLVFEYMSLDLYTYMLNLIYIKQIKLDPILLKSYAYQLLTGLYVLHTHQIIHRDIKPSNLLLDKSGALKISDFGLARYYSLPLRQYTPNVVTYAYRAPELLFGGQNYDTGVDVWSAGCVIAEMSRGKALFHPDSDIQLMHQMIETFGTPEQARSIFNVGEDVEIPFHEKQLMRTVLQTENDVFCNFVSSLLTYDPTKRLTASAALKHEYFNDLPQSVKNAMNVE